MCGPLLTVAAFMDVIGPRIDAFFAVNATQYRPELAVVPFSVHLNDARIDLSVPTWDTHRCFGTADFIEIGKIGDLTATGSYRYYSTPQSDHQETLSLHLEVRPYSVQQLTMQGRHIVFKALGWAVRRMFCVKDNYFGGFTQYTTMQEYLERFDHDPESVGDPVKEKYRPGMVSMCGILQALLKRASLIPAP